MGSKYNCHTYSCIEDLDAIFEDFSDKNKKYVKLGLGVSELAWHTDILYDKDDAYADSTNEDGEISFVGNPYYDENGRINEEGRRQFINDAQTFIGSYAG